MTNYILLVDDSQDIHEIFGLHTKNAQLSWRGFLNPLQALKFLDNCSKLPSVIITDHEMPEMNGLDFRKEILNRPNLASVPCILLTANQLSPDELRGLNFWKVVEKPISFTQLLSMLPQ
ncbi:response regulator [bacterium]|nr:response regulator [bacterium]